MSSQQLSKSSVGVIQMRAAACLAVFMFAVEPLNLSNIGSEWVALVSIICFIGIIIGNLSDLLYSMTKIFFHSLLSIFFSSIEVIGKQNIPSYGPVIFTGNHMNQFVDAAIIMSTNPHRIGFLVAQKSYDKPVIGHFAKAVGSIPVIRPQDNSVKGVGKVKFEGNLLHGQNTEFKKLLKGDKIRPGKTPDGYQVKEILSDTELVLTEMEREVGVITPLDEPQDEWMNYEILGFVDQSKLFEHVHQALARGECLGIFPEGGSHDRTDLLPLKLGIAVIAFGVLDKFNVNTPIVPVGLNYFRGHRFRGRVVVEFGTPFRIDQKLLKTYRESKKKGYKELLTNVEEAMRSVIVPASDYGELKLLHTTRRLYQESTSVVSTKQKQDLARRFAIGYHLLKLKVGLLDHSGVEKLPDDMEALQQRLQAYQDMLDEWGLRDYQINSLETPFATNLYIFAHALILWILSSIPALILNAPIGMAARAWASREAKKDLKNSRVKIQARDVLLSKKILFSIVAIPTLWMTYALVLFLMGFSARFVAVFMISCPVFSYCGVMGVEAGMVDLKDLRPFFLRLLPSFKAVVKALPNERSLLRKDVIRVIKKYGPTIGDIYFNKDVQWEQELKKIKTLRKEVMTARGEIVDDDDEDEDGPKMKSNLSFSTLAETQAAEFSHLPALSELHEDEEEVQEMNAQDTQSTEDQVEGLDIDNDDENKKNN